MVDERTAAVLFLRAEANGQRRKRGATAREEWVAGYLDVLADAIKQGLHLDLDEWKRQSW